MADHRIEGYVIKLGKKEEGGGKIEEIVIYERGNYLQDNLILADSGSMQVSEDKRYLEFNLKNGTRYEEKGMRNSTSTELTRIAFREYKKVFDISSFFRVQTDDSLFKDNYRMLSVRQLNVVIDSANKRTNKLLARINKEVPFSFQFPKWYDSGKLKPSSVVPKKTIKKMSEIIPDSLRQNVDDMALAKLSGAKSGLDVLINDYKERAREMRHFQLARQQKFSLSFACFVLFMIGAPLGSIIRKGGLGSPLVFAVIFFVIFHLLNTVGEKLVKEGVLGDFVGTWLPSLVLLPVGIFLTYKAMRDSQLFNKEYYYRVFKKYRAYIQRKRSGEQEVSA
jgi:lipopolysaccharide export system permease protein